MNALINLLAIVGAICVLSLATLLWLLVAEEWESRRRGRGLR